jgi:hypothetical protein
MQQAVAVPLLHLPCDPGPVPIVVNLGSDHIIVQVGAESKQSHTVFIFELTHLDGHADVARFGIHETGIFIFEKSVRPPNTYMLGVRMSLFTSTHLGIRKRPLHKLELIAVIGCVGVVAEVPVCQVNQVASIV